MQLKTTPEDFIVVEIARHDVRESGPYALLELTKRNLSTERALFALAESLNLPRRFLGYAGAKDARALTKQYITVKASEGLLEQLKRLRPTGFAVRLIGYLPEPLGLGQLEKNRFEIVVRRIQDERIAPLSRIPNYFDEQRFSKANAQLGRHIVKGEFKLAVELLLKTDTEMEPKLTQYLETRPTDWIGALRLMPKNILLMYVHAYQSLLFNEVLTRYIRENDPAAVLVDGPVPIMVPSKDLADAQIPLFGFGTESHPVFGAWYEELLAREGLEPRDFVIRSLPFLTVEGSERSAFFAVEGLDAGPLEQDDIFPGFQKQRLTFTLPKAAYATMVVKCLYKAGRVSGERGE